MPAHPVVGHERTLSSEWYTKMRNQIIYIAQYWTGNGSFIGHGGWNYQVMVKESPVKIVQYKNKWQ